MTAAVLHFPPRPDPALTVTPPRVPRRNWFRDRPWWWPASRWERLRLLEAQVELLRERVDIATTPPWGLA